MKHISTFTCGFLFILLVDNTLGSAESKPVLETSMFMASLRVVWGLLIVLGIIYALYAFARKKFNFLPANNTNSLIKVIEAKHLMPKKSIYLLEVRDKEYLVGVTDHSISLLSSSLKTESFQEVFGDTVKGVENHE